MLTEKEMHMQVMSREIHQEVSFRIIHLARDTVKTTKTRPLTYHVFPTIATAARSISRYRRSVSLQRVHNMFQNWTIQ